jgi:hypothetical protein
MQPNPALPQHERADDHEMHRIERDPGGKRRGIKPGVVIDRASGPAARRHPGAAEQQHRRDPPARALQLYEQLMRQLVTELDNSWELTSADIDAALAELDD